MYLVPLCFKLMLLPSSVLALTFQLSRHSFLYQSALPTASKNISVYGAPTKLGGGLQNGRFVNPNINDKNRGWRPRALTVALRSNIGSNHKHHHRSREKIRISSRQDIRIMAKKVKEENVDTVGIDVSKEIEEQIPPTGGKRIRQSRQKQNADGTGKPAKRQAKQKTVKVKISNGIRDDTIASFRPKKEPNLEQTDKIVDVKLPTSTKKRNNNNNKVEQCITECDLLPKLWHPHSQTNHFKILSWNVNGIRAVLKKYPDALPELAKSHNPDLICIQETKLQETHVEDPKLKLKGFLLENEGYDSYWSCSKTTLGYSGTAIFIKRKNNNNGNETTTITSIVKSDSGTQKQQSKLQTFFKSKKVQSNTVEDSTTTSSHSIDSLFIPQKISFGMNSDGDDPEGRCIVIDYPMFSIINTYVPNAGEGLKRLDYRIQQWDVNLRNEMKKIEDTRGLPVILVGDLNVAHMSLDVWNDRAKHLDKCAGTTPEERESFTKTLNSNGFIDLFRHLHEEARGHYTFWSTRAGNRSSNKGMRLDYFVGSKNLVDGDNAMQVIARDSYMLRDQLGSDHCPIVLELEVKSGNNNKKNE